MLLRADVRFAPGTAVQVGRFLGEDLKIHATCSMAIEECRKGHGGCRGWVHWATGSHVCPGHENDRVITRDLMAWPREWGS